MIRSLRGLNLITTHPYQHTLRDLYDRNPSEEYMLAHFYLTSQGLALRAEPRAVI